MPVFTPYADVPYRFDLASLQPIADGIITSETSTQIVVENDEYDERYVFGGTFANYDPVTGIPGSGTVTSFSLYVGATLYYTITGLSLSAPLVANYILNDNMTALMDALLAGNDTLHARSGTYQDDLMYGLAGNDTIWLYEGDDIGYGGAGNDTLYAGGGSDTLYGENGDDWLYLSDAGDDFVDGGAGTDNLAYSGNLGISLNLNLTGPQDTGAGVWTVRNVENVYAGWGDDYLYGRPGDDMLSGGAGDDFLSGGAGSNTLSGSDGYDFLTYSWASSGVTVDLGTTAQQNTGVSLDYIFNVEDLYGTAFKDVLRGSTRDNFLYGGSGDDTLYGEDGADVIDGGAGNDVLDGGAGIDTVSYATAVGLVNVTVGLNAYQNTGYGGPGRPIEFEVDSLTGFENVIGSSFSDGLVGDSATNILVGGRGHDTLIGHAGDDYLDGGAGRDTAIFGAASTAATWVRNGDGSWTVNAGAGSDTVTDVEVLRFSDRTVTLANPLDFNGDGLSDLLWRHTNGTVDAWLTTAGADYDFADANQGIVDSAWTIAQQGDFNGDGKNDLLWRHSGGNTNVWLSGAGTGVGFTGRGLGEISTAWQIQQSADFNGDGKNDVVWRHTNGTVNIWASNDGSGYTGFTGEGFGAIDNAWTIKGADDFNGDGRADMLWRHSSGAVNIWMSDATTGAISFTGDNLGIISTDWTVQGTGDFNGDRKADVLWRHSSGATNVWLSNGGVDFTGLTGNDLGVIPADWVVSDIADYNGDSKADIVWRHADGNVNIWMSNSGFGFTGLTGQYVGAVPTDWFII